MKILNKITILLIISTAFIFTSCDNDDDNSVNAPVISDVEIGIGNSLIGYPGTDLHLEAEVEAEGKISTITVEMHKEDGTDEEYEQTWTEFEGLLNVHFHEHFDIPATATTGEYHFHLVVTDMEGNQTEYEADLDVQELNDTQAPTFNFTSTPTNNQVFNNGETISISGEVTDNIGLGGMLVALVRTNDNIADADVTGDNSSIIVMLHTHDFGADPDEHTFNASINVGATHDNNMTPAEITGDNAWQSGNYYILVRAKDQSGNWTFSNHYPIEISL